MDENTIAIYIEQNYKYKSFPLIYKAFRRSTGVPRIVLSRIVARRLAEGSYFVESTVIDEILDNCGLETIWSLASGTNNDFIKAKCIERLNEFIENENNVEYEKQKMSKEMIEYVFGEIVDESKLVDGEEDCHGKYKGR
jgi:hypothetical protein